MSQAGQASRIAVLLFTDMANAVALEHRLGTDAYSRLLKLHHQQFREALNTVGAGKIHQDTGAGFLAEFNTAADAVHAALLFTAYLRETKWEGEAPQVRVGLHQGQLSEIRLDPASPSKIVGLPISVAARVMGLAIPGQILMTRPVHDDARQFVREHPSGRDSQAGPPLRWKSHGAYLLKGAESPIELFEVGAAGFAPLSSPPAADKGQPVMEPLPSPPPARVAAPGPAEPARRRGPRAWLCGSLTALFGLCLLFLPQGDLWVNASYDYLFLFGTRPITNQVVVIFMDDIAYAELGQTRDKPRDRALHTRLLNKLADDGCPLVVFDVRFLNPADAETDKSMAAAIRRLPNVVLAADQARLTHPGLEAARPRLPLEIFLRSAKTNWGVAWLDPDLDGVVRRHWPFPNPGPYASLPWTAARLSGASLSSFPEPRWLRYYSVGGPWIPLSYHLALAKGPNYFRGKVVFIGNRPKTPLPDAETDEFRVPSTRWTSEAVGGMEILTTSYLNLVNGEWLHRLAWPWEGLVLLGSGAGIFTLLRHLKRWQFWVWAIFLFFLLTIAAAMLSYFTNYWFPWLIVTGGQLPLALILAWMMGQEPRLQPIAPATAPVEKPAPGKTIVLSFPEEALPDAPEYEIFDPPIGQGGFGKVWIVRNAIGQYQALKAVYQSNFGDNLKPYEAEFLGIQKYKPVSEKHPGLLRIDLVSRKKSEGYFYYVMELGDAQTPGWEKHPATYKPMDLDNLRKRANDRRLPAADCLRITTVLAEALGFLHQQGLTHRDIKPSNVIFAGGRPKLADVGLVTNIRPAGSENTMIGTPGYMPPAPERPGTPQADLYALGMLLYVIATGKDPVFHAELAKALKSPNLPEELRLLESIILKACHPDLAQRYSSAEQMLVDLAAASKSLTARSLAE